MKVVIAFGATVCRCTFVALLASAAALSSAAAVKEPELLEPEKAFRISTRALDENNVEVRFAIADGYIGVCYVPLEQFVEARLPGRSSAAPAAVRQGGAR